MPAENMVYERFEATVKDKIGDGCKDTEYEYGGGGEIDPRLGVKRRTYRQSDKKKSILDQLNTTTSLSRVASTKQ